MTGKVFQEFQEELDRLRVQYKDDPRQELLILFLTALEREELVSTGYRESLMAERLKSLRVSSNVREMPKRPRGFVGTELLILPIVNPT